ncbi:unnamed protein product, partial [Prorocentrum cordatum]
MRLKALHLFAEHKRRADVAAVLRSLGLQAHLEEVGLARSDNADLSDAALGACPKMLTTGPRPVRSEKHPWGFPWLEGREALKCQVSNLPVDFDLCALQTQLASIKQAAGLRGKTWTAAPSTWASSAVNVPPACGSCQPARLIGQFPGLAADPRLYRWRLHFAANGACRGLLPQPPAGLQSLDRGRGDSAFKTEGAATWPPQLCGWVAHGIGGLAQWLAAYRWRGTISLFAEWLTTRPDLLAALSELDGATLRGYCDVNS